MIEDLTLNPACIPDDRAAPRAADRVDLATLVATHSALLFRVCFAVLRDRAEAEDAVQDTFLRVLQHERSLSTVRELRPWLVRIAWRLAIDRRRRRRTEQMDEHFAASLVSPGLSPEAALAEARRLAAILREVDRLPRAEREVLLLSTEAEGLTHPASPTSADLTGAELAATLGRSPSATRALLFRARARLRDRLAEKGLS